MVRRRQDTICGNRHVVPNRDSIADIEDTPRIDECLFADDDVSCPPAALNFTKESTYDPAPITILDPLIESSMSAFGETYAVGWISIMDLR
jgi:hypothetical protein